MDSEPTPRLRRAGQTAIRSLWSLPIRDFLLNGQFERRFSATTPCQQKSPTPRRWAFLLCCNADLDASTVLSRFRCTPILQRIQ